MKYLNKIAFILATSLLILSCTSKPPYEIKSPCVSSGENNPYIIVPCSKKPLNFNHTII